MITITDTCSTCGQELHRWWGPRQHAANAVEKPEFCRVPWCGGKVVRTTIDHDDPNAISNT